MVKPISDSARVVLADSRTPRVRAAQDLGPVSSETPLQGITLVFRRSAAQEAELQQLLAALQDPASPQYHHWLTTEDFAARFGVADKDIATTENWLSSHGFHVEGVARSRDRITFSGSASQVQSAFGADLHQYRVEGESHFAPVSDLTLPAELASVTATVLHLSDFRPKPSWKALPSSKPDFTSSPAMQHYLTPGDVATMYSRPVDYNLGSGQGLAIVGQSYVDMSSSLGFFSFQTSMVGINNPIIPVLVPDSGVEAISWGDEGESELDLEYSSGIAIHTSIFFVHVGSSQNYSVFDALAYAITQNIAPVVSISYGECEPLMSAAELDSHNALFQEAAAQGQTLVASSGDSGSTACAPYSTTSGVTTAQKQQLSVNFPASSPYVTAVGGTQMAPGTFTAGTNPYWAGYVDSPLTSSLLSYVPEVTWNEGSTGHSPLAGGGGTSSHYPMPPWQSSFPGMPTGTFRLLPDVSLLSAVASPGFIVCSSDPYLRRSTDICPSGVMDSTQTLTIAGGTSFAAPIFAGFIAILNQAQHVTGQGNINPQLYSLAANPGSNPSPFHDITSGTIACVAGATNCVPANQSSYPATSGYDQATGLGSIDLKALMDAWPASSTAKLQATEISLQPWEKNVAPGDTAKIYVRVGPPYTDQPTTLPTGDVSVLVDGTVVAPSLTFTDIDTTYSQEGVYFSFIAPSTSGSHLIVAKYPGDATHSPATATTAVMVGNVQASGSMILSVGNLTVANGSTGSTDVTVTPSGYNGTLFWSLSATSTSATSLTGCFGIAPLTVDNFSQTKLTIGIGSACNAPTPSNRGVFRTLGQHASTIGHRSFDWHNAPASAVYASLLLCGCLASRRRKWRSLLVLIILLVPIAGMNLIGCGGGGGSNSNPTTPTTPTTPSTATTYSLTLTGTDSVNTSLTASTTFTLTVK